jgi:hypothetical protein
MLSVIMLNITSKPFMFSVIMLNVVMLSVVAPHVVLISFSSSSNQHFLNNLIKQCKLIDLLRSLCDL